MTFKGEKWDWETDLWDQAEAEKNAYVPYRHSNVSTATRKTNSRGLYMEFLNEVEPTSSGTPTPVMEASKNLPLSEVVNAKPVRGRPYYKKQVEAQPGENIKNSIEMQLRANGPAISNECIEQMVRNHSSKVNSDAQDDDFFPDLSFQRSSSND